MMDIIWLLIQHKLLLYMTASLHIDYPMLFELQNAAAERSSHCGVLEFIAEEGMIYMPYWVGAIYWLILSVWLAPDVHYLIIVSCFRWWRIYCYKKETSYVWKMWLFQRVHTLNCNLTLKTSWIFPTRKLCESIKVFFLLALAEIHKLSAIV